MFHLFIVAVDIIQYFVGITFIVSIYSMTGRENIHMVRNCSADPVLMSPEIFLYSAGLLVKIITDMHSSKTYACLRVQFTTVLVAEN